MDKSGVWFEIHSILKMVHIRADTKWRVNFPLASFFSCAVANLLCPNSLVYGLKEHDVFLLFCHKKYISAVTSFNNIMDVIFVNKQLSDGTSICFLWCFCSRVLPPGLPRGPPMQQRRCHWGQTQYDSETTNTYHSLVLNGRGIKPFIPPNGWFVGVSVTIH